MTSRERLGSTRERAGGFLVRQGHLVLLSLLISFQLAVNWAWLSTNVVIIGWDRPRHLIESLVYNNILEQVNLNSLFDALTHSGYYPPLFHWSMVAFYKLFGVSMDVAAMANMLFLVILLVSAYGIGREIGGKGVGLLTAFITSTLPMVFAMSRYTYMEFSLTAMVALSIWLLLLSRDFTHRGYTLLFGLSLGLGLLSKWTFSLFVFPPLAVVVSRMVLHPGLRESLRSFSRDKRWVALSVALGLILTLVWYLPNTQRIAELPLSHLLLLISWFLFSVLVYLLGQPSVPVVNLIGGLWLGAVVAGSWYLSRVDFVNHTFLIAWGRPERHSWAFGYYMDHLIHEQLSLVYVVLLVVTSFGLLILAARTLRHGQGWREIWRSNLSLLVLWVVVPYVVFSFRPSSRHSRFIMPILPALAAVMAYGLSKIRFSKLRVVAVALVVLVGTGQLLALSFDSLDWLRQGAVIGAVDLFAHKFQNQLPSSGQTDRGFWAAPDILSYVSENAEANDEAVELALLVNAWQVHDEHFLYLIYTDFLQVTLRELAQNWTGRPAYPQLFEVDYIAVAKDNRTHRLDAETLEVVQMLLEAPPVLFRDAFELAKEYPLPDDNIIYLYERRYPLPEGNDCQAYEALAADLDAYLAGEGTLVLCPSYQVTLLGRYYLGAPDLLVLSAQEPVDEASIVRSLEETAAQHERVATVFEAGEAEEIQSVAGRWLSENCFPTREAWYGSAYLALYACPQGMEGREAHTAVEASFGEAISLLGYNGVPDKATAGETIRLTLLWRADAEIGTDYKTFVHLLGGEGILVAQRDSEPLGGWRPTTGWRSGELIRDHYGLVIPEDLPEGEYELVVGMYDADGDRLPVLDDRGQVVGDSVSVGFIEVGGS